MEIILEKNDLKFQIKSSNILYDISICLSSGNIIVFKYKTINEILFTFKEFKFEEFQIINRLFTIYDNINEIFQSIKDIIFFNKNPDIIEREKKLYLKIYPNLGKYNFIEIPLDKEQELQTIKINEDFLNQIEEDIKMFDSFVNSYEYNIKKLEIENKEL